MQPPTVGGIIRETSKLNNPTQMDAGIINMQSDALIQQLQNFLTHKQNGSSKSVLQIQATYHLTS